MANDSFRYRTVFEIGCIALVIYFFLGTPGLSISGSASLQTGSPEDNVPISKAKLDTLVYPFENLRCPEHRSKNTHIFSTNPLIIYINGFLSPAEADHLIDISSEKWQPSTIFNAGHEETDESVRKSEKAMIDRDEIVQCIEARALAFQGWPQETFIERLWTQRYNVSGHYAHHYDWATASKTSRRTSTFMVYLSAEDECEGGGTNFPRVERLGDGRWCDFVECGEGGRSTRGKDVEGVTFKVRKGAAVYWENFDAEGRGSKETIHAGMPVRRGTKVGLNIWSWYQKGHEVPS